MNNETPTVQPNYDQPPAATPEATPEVTPQAPQEALAVPGLQELEQPWSGPEAADTQDPGNVAEAEADAVEGRESTGETRDETRGSINTGMARSALTVLPRAPEA